MESRRVPTKQAELKRKVFHFAICSRLFVLILSFASNVLLSDHNAGVFLFPQPPVNISLVDSSIDKIFGGLSRWDAQYFLHISHYGYTYENTLAFFPLFPFLTNVVSVVVNIVAGQIINPVSAVLLSALVINFIFFLHAATTLFELSCKILKDVKLGYISALLFCINPASIFFTAPYSESCFSYFTFSGMLYCIDNDVFLSSFASGLSSCVRSNGLLNLGFIAHKCLKNIITFASTTKPLFSILRFTFVQVLKVFIYGVIFILPFVIFQSYAYAMFCFKNTNQILELPDFVREFGELNKFVMPGTKIPPWCSHSVPFSYSYVQNHYWNVGFIKYYKLKQIPNFILALPVIFLMSYNIRKFITENKSSVFSLGFKKLEFVIFDKRKVNPEFLVFVIHGLFLTMVCVFFIHVQVTTRMIASSCPVLYWFLAVRYSTGPAAPGGDSITSRLNTVLSSRKYCIVETNNNMASIWRNVVLNEKSSDSWTLFIKTYFCVYLIVGTVLFSNFYPWT